MLRTLLRGVAVAIAVLGAIDPSISLARRTRQPLVIAAGEPNDAVLASAARIREALADEYDVRVRSTDADPQLPLCGEGEGCVLVGQEAWRLGAVDARARVLGAVQIAASGSRVAIERVAISPTVHAQALGRLVVDLRGRDVNGGESQIDVFDGNVPVGHAVHQWTAEERVSIPINWWPVAPGPRRLSIVTSLAERHETTSDRVDVGVEVVSRPHNVLVYDTRPSWTSTFVRRAIEDDGRFALRVLAGISPRVQVTEGAPFRLDEATLTEASAVIIGAPDDLSPREVEMLDRYVRVRGGSLILAPDRRPTGPIVRLLPSPMVERLEPAPVMVGEWRASELLLFPKPGAGHQVLAKAGADAAALVAPSGNGRVIVSGAMDAWRYRDTQGAAFDVAWRSLIADAAEAGGRPLEVTATPAAARPADEVHVVARVRSMALPDAAVAVSASVRCGDSKTPRVLRLWPTGDRRRFEGRFAPSAQGTCEIAASSSAPVVASETASLLVQPDFHSRAILSKVSDPSRGGMRRIDTIEQLTNSAGARVFAAGDEASLASDVRRLSPALMAPADVRPMRSAWWIVPFAGCLAAEWWLRRRRGMR